MHFLPRLTRLLSRLCLYTCLYLTGSYATVQAEPLTICYHYGCSKNASFQVGHALRDELLTLFKPARQPAEERAAIAQAVQRLYLAAAEHAPIAADRGGNFADGSADGRMDCVDHSQNDTTFLQYLAQQGLLQHHRVAAPVWRAPWIIDLHYASQIIEIASETPWVVDSWFFDFGHEPVVVPYQQWKKG